MNEEYKNGNLLRWRVDQLERNQASIEKKIDKLTARFTGMIITLGCGSLTFSLTILAATGKI